MPIRIPTILTLAMVLAAWLPLSVQNAPTQAAITLVSPSACPPSGSATGPATRCAAGQRLNFKVDFSATRVDPARTPNLQVCFYASMTWLSTGFSFSPTGATTGLAYTSSSANCGAPPTNYFLLGGATANLPSATASDSLPFAFRIGANATGDGNVLVRVYEQDNTNAWPMTGETTTAPVSTAPTAATVYVANDAAACGANSPCFLNSQDDLADGVGTGLKDAIDAAVSPATLSILGNYTIKQHPVLVDKPHTLKSGPSGKITFTSTNPVCNLPMLLLTTAAKLSGLAMDDGSCASSPARDLVAISNTSANPTVVESSDLTGGLNAIMVYPANTAGLIARYNHISGNAGYAIFLDSTNTGSLNAYANNLFGNRVGVQVDCNGAGKGIVDHNFWGIGVLASTGSANCTATNSKQLGARAWRISGNPGVDAQLVTVGASSVQYAFNNQIGYQRTATGSDFGLVIVNHGYGNPENVPFKTGSLGNLTSCNNFYDIFLADSAIPTGALTLTLKYNLTSACATTVETGQYCNQIVNPSAYPLWFYDFSAEDWKTTGAGGQLTTCRMGANKEIQVNIDSNSANHPNYADLARLPFTLALPGGVAVSDLGALPGSQQATISWTTTKEENVSGFYVQRSDNETIGFADVNPSLIAHLGSGGGGASYQYTDSGLTNYVLYYYRLKIVKPDNSYSFTKAVRAEPTAAPPTITNTPTLTRFPTSTFFYRSPTATRTFTPSPTSPFKTITNTPLVTGTDLTAIASGSKAPYPAGTAETGTVDPSTALARTRVVRTEIVMLSETPTPTTAPPPSHGDVTGPLTVVLAVLAAGTLAGGAIYLIRERVKGGG